MKKPTQKQRVERRLLQYGSISRNECLNVYISRLSGIIQLLEQEGWVFDTSNQNKQDYIYRVVSSPYKPVIRTLSNGEQIKTYERVK
jgi:hypothetical protein